MNYHSENKCMDKKADICLFLAGKCNYLISCIISVNYFFVSYNQIILLQFLCILYVMVCEEYSH